MDGQAQQVLPPAGRRLSPLQVRQGRGPGRWFPCREPRAPLSPPPWFGVSGALSGLLIDEYDGVAGVLEWVLRTLVTSAVLALGAGLLLVLRLRHRMKPRPLGWALTLVAAAAFDFFIVQPVVFAVYLTHLPTRRVVHDTDLGARKQPTTLTTASACACAVGICRRATAPPWPCSAARAATGSASPTMRGCWPGTATAS
jgi:hypothetical protein